MAPRDWARLAPGDLIKADSPDSRPRKVLYHSEQNNTIILQHASKKTGGKAVYSSYDAEHFTIVKKANISEKKAARREFTMFSY